jgi:threonyl-tRNA synthetase
MYNVTENHRTFAIWMMNCTTTCSIYKTETPGPTLYSLTYCDISRYRRRLYINIGGSYGFFTCQYS